MTAAPTAPAPISPAGPALYAVPDAPAPRLDATEVLAFTEAAWTAVRFLPLPLSDRAQVVSDLRHLEDEARRGDMRPHLVAALRLEIETTIEAHAAGSAGAGPVAG